MLLRITLVWIFFAIEMIESINGSKDREKRYLLEPLTTQFGMFVTLATPIEDMSSVSFAYFIEANYFTLANVSYLDPDLIGAPVLEGSGLRVEGEIMEKSNSNKNSNYVGEKDEHNPTVFYDPPRYGFQIVSSARENSKRSVDLEGNTKINRRLVYSILQQNLERQGFEGRSCILRAICENAQAPFHHNGVLGNILHIIFTPTTSEDEDLPDDFYKAEHIGAELQDCSPFLPNCPYSILDDISLLL